jgi:glycosyltransferase involved in cell wall biosynthesis
MEQASTPIPACATVRISSYVLTLDSERHLPQILERLIEFSDEIIIVDSGSTDRTQPIAESYGCRFVSHPFEHFRAQRAFATSLCTGEFVFFCDCDEIPSAALAQWLRSQKSATFSHLRYRIRREWYAFGRRVHAVYPVPSPDYPTRLVHRSVATYTRSPEVHERYDDDRQDAQMIEHPLHHFSFETRTELLAKLWRYTKFDAVVLERESHPAPLLAFKLLTSPIGAFLLWYFRRRGCLDGAAGLQLSMYAAIYKLLKYARALKYRVTLVRPRRGPRGAASTRGIGRPDRPLA